MRASLVLILTEVLILNLTCTSRVRVRRHNLKVRITATGDTIVLKFLQLEADARLEGYILGYGSGMFSKQFIQLPEEGEHYETEIDAEPKYLIVVRPVKANNVKKKCTGKVSLEKPLHLMIGTVTPTSVQLSWGTLLNTPYTDAHLDDCIEDGDFTVRYKEKETSKKWNYETCPTTDTVIDNLKPDTPYEFEVRAETETNTGTWSPPVIHNTADIHIHEPLKSSNPLKPQIHVMEGPKVAFPPVTILHNITPSRQPPPVRQTASPPTPRRNQGTGSDGITPSSPSEDTLFSTQTLKFMQTLMNQRTSKTANPFQPQPSTLSPLSSRSLQQPHTIQFQLNTAKAQSSTPDTEPITQSITTKTQPSTTETHASTVKAQFHTTHIRTTQFHSTGQPQSNTIQPQFRTYQPHASTAIPHFRTSQPKPSTELVHCRTTRCDPQITQSIPRTTQKEPITAQPEPIITKPKHITAQKMPITAHPETIATKSLPSTKPQTPSTSQLRATQLKSLTTQAKPRILQKTSTTQSQTTKQIFSTALPTNVVQQQIPTQPNTIYEHVSLTLPQPQKTKKEPIKLHQPTLSGTTHHDPYEDMSKSIQEHNTYHHLDTTRPKQVSSTNASPTTSTKDNVFTNIPLTLTSPKTDKQGSMASQHLISQHTHYDTKETPSPVQTSDWYTPSTLEITAKTRDHPLRSTKFQKEPVLVQDHHPLSSTIKIPYTVQWQYAKTDSTPRSELRIINDLHSGANNVPEQPPTKIQANIIKKTPTKSNVSHWPETQAMNEKLSGSQEAPSQSQDGEPLPKPALVNEVVDRDQGQDISRNSSSPVLVTRPAGPKVVQPVGTKVVRPVGPKVVRPVGPKVVRPVGPKVVRPVGPKVVRNGTGPAKWASHNSSSPVVVRRPVGPTVVPALVSAVVRNETHPMKTDSRNPPRRVARPLSPTVGRNRTSTGRGPPGSSKNPKRPPKVPGGVKHQGLSQTKPTNRPRKHFGSPGHQRVSDSKKKNPNQVEQSTGKAKITDLKQVERLPVLKPQAAPSTEKTTYQKPTPTSMPLFAFNEP
ncbi:uncharacterized protein abi3bpa isoform X2 [Brachyhypopomus gauderio]|uniref:uncharacterized protein abi3bpa isoform X2 n=1 Tax=Brachyhypopomus gauderio TaxID=698409 RepID=UPI004041059C